MFCWSHNAQCLNLSESLAFVILSCATEKFLAHIGAIIRIIKIIIISLFLLEKCFSFKYLDIVIAENNITNGTAYSIVLTTLKLPIKKTKLIKNNVMNSSFFLIFVLKKEKIENINNGKIMNEFLKTLNNSGVFHSVGIGNSVTVRIFLIISNPAIQDITRLLGK